MTAPDVEMTARDRHLFGPGPKRILSLDGGGVRGIVSIAFLERIEALLSAETGRPMRLCDHFDLIGGTSTGALIAACLALGYSATQVREFYIELAPRIFHRSRWRMLGLQARFDARPLRVEISRVLGTRSLESADLQTGLAMIAKRMDTGSAWLLSNNPRSPFWNDAPDGTHIGNRHFLLAAIVRASTAAPGFFAPELVSIIAGQPPGLFVDGGVTPYKNPALQLLMMALIDQYGLKWQSGANNLQIVSIGTGDHRERIDPTKASRMTAAGMVFHALVGTLADTSTSALMMLHWLSGTSACWPINAEVGDLSKSRPPGGVPLFDFLRYDVQLEADWLQAELGMKVLPDTVAALRRLDEPASVPQLYEIGQRAAERFVHTTDFQSTAFGALDVMGTQNQP